MKKTLFKLTSALPLATLLLSALSKMAYAQGLKGLRNPIIESEHNTVEGAQSGKTFAFYFIYFWNVLVVIGGLAVLIIFIMGAFDWLTAGGEKSRIESARLKIINATIGMVILAGSYAVLQFISNLFGFNLLNPQIQNLLPK